MPDFNQQFERFREEFSRQRQEFAESNHTSNENEKQILGSLKELTDLAKMQIMLEEKKQKKDKAEKREDSIEGARKRKDDEKSKKSTEESTSILRELKNRYFALFTPKIIGAAIGLGIADALTEFNLRQAGFAARVLNDMQKGLGIGGKVSQSIKHAGKPNVIPFPLSEPGAAAKTFGKSLRGVSSIFKTFTKIFKPLLSILSKAALFLTPIIAVFEGFIAGFKKIAEGGDMADAVVSFLGAAIKSLTIDFIMGLKDLFVLTFQVIGRLIEKIPGGAWLMDWFGWGPESRKRESAENARIRKENNVAGKHMLAASGLSDAAQELYWATKSDEERTEFEESAKFMQGLENMENKVQETMKARIARGEDPEEEKVRERAMRKLLLENGEFRSKLQEDQVERIGHHYPPPHEAAMSMNIQNVPIVELIDMYGEDFINKHKKNSEETLKRLGPNKTEIDTLNRQSAENAKEEATGAAKLIKNTLQGMTEGFGDVLNPDDMLEIPQEFKDKMEEFTRGIAGKISEVGRNALDMSTNLDPMAMIASVSHASKRGAARNYGFTSTIKDRFNDPHKTHPMFPGLPVGLPGGLPGVPGHMPGGMPSLPGGLPGGPWMPVGPPYPTMGPGVGVDNQGQHLMSMSATNSMTNNMQPPVVVPINNTSTNQVVHNSSSNTTLALGNIQNESRSIMSSMLSDGLHESLI